MAVEVGYGPVAGGRTDAAGVAKRLISFDAVTMVTVQVYEVEVVT